MTNHPHGYNYGKLLRELFPEQTKSILSIAVWTLVFLADLAAVFWLAGHLGLSLLEIGSSNLRMLALGGHLIAALGIFSLEAFAYNRIIALFR